MPPENNLQTTTPQTLPINNQEVLANILQITTGRQYTPTPEQVDKLIALQEKAMDYTHKDNQSFLPKDILRYAAFAFTLIVVCVIFVFSTFYAKEYIGEIIAGIFGLIAGGAGGYGYGSRKR